MNKAELIAKRNALTNELRSVLDKWETVTKNPTHQFDNQADGNYKERAAKIEADLDKVEAELSLAQTRAKLDAMDNEPVFDTRGIATGQTVGEQNEEYEKRFLEALRTGNPASLRLMSIGAAGGAAAVPADWEKSIIEKLYQENVIRRIATVTPVDGQKKLTIENALPTTELVAENTAMSSPSDPTFGSLIAVYPYKFQTKVVVTNEFLEDSFGQGGVGSIREYITSKIAMSQGRKQEDFYCNGTNSSQPQGMGTTEFNDILAALSPSQVIELGAVNTPIASITGDNIIDTYFAIKPQYRVNGSWVMSDDVMKTIRKIKTATSGSNEYIYKIDTTGDLREGIAGTLLGRPVYISAFYNTTASAKKPYVTFGDFRFYNIFDRTNMQMLIDPFVDAAKYTTNIYAYMRTDAKVTQAEAFAQLSCKRS